MDMDDDSDGDLVYMALCGYANWIETENFLLSARDAAAQKKPFKALELAQMRRVLRLREMADYFLKHGRELTFKWDDLKLKSHEIARLRRGEPAIKGGSR